MLASRQTDRTHGTCGGAAGMKPGYEPLTIKMAWRNLSRYRQRTFFSILGVTIGCSVSLLNISLVKGKVDLFIRTVAEGGVGHLRVVDQNWLDSRDLNLRLKDFRQELKAVRAIPEVLVATPRARVQALAAMGTRLQGTELAGVDPESEPVALRAARMVAKGRYLNSLDRHKIVIGKALAESLRADIGDSLVITAVDPNGNLQNQMFEIIGLVNLGHEQMEKAFAHVRLPDISELSGITGVGEITVLLRNADDLGRIATEIKAALPAGDSVLTWKEISPEANLAIQINEASARILTFIFVLVAFLGVSSAQLTAVLERRREFAVLSALGTRGTTLIKFILMESFFIGSFSFVSTLVLSVPLALALEKIGIRIFSGSGQLSGMGSAFDGVIRGQLGWWIVWDAFFLCYLSTLFSGIYPALFAARVDPVNALRAAQ